MNFDKITGFKQYNRVEEAYRPVEQRVKNYKEFVITLTDAQVGQQTARCMDCGTPFCTSGCPVNNIIPDFNNLVHDSDWQNAAAVLHSTNNFPEFTGRICPAPCEAACTLTISDSAVGIKSIEHAIIDKAWDRGWVVPQPSTVKTNKRVAIVGGGPAGMAAAQQLARAGHSVTVFEKNDRIGGLLRYGIPDFKMEKHLIDRRVEQMQAEGVTFETLVFVGREPADNVIVDYSQQHIDPQQLLFGFDAVIIAGGAEQPRDISIPGRDLKGVHYAMEFLVPQNKENAGDFVNNLSAKNKNIVIIGGGDTGSDCVGTSNRHGAAHITQIAHGTKPPAEAETPLVWPYWPNKMRVSSSHDEGCDRYWSVVTKRFEGSGGQVERLIVADTEWRDGSMHEVPNTERAIPADMVLLAVGFRSPAQQVLDAFGVAIDLRGNALATTEDQLAYQTSVPKVFAAGDMRRGQSLVVWAIREGRQCAHAVDKFLMGSSVLPL